MNSLVKPFAERMAEAMVFPPEGVEWQKGYCPICGSWPNMDLIKGNEGHRWLRCSFCSHQWRFPRIVCPFCETEDHDKIEIIYSEARPFERAELCHNCRHYLAGIDTRELNVEPVLEVERFGVGLS